MGRTTAGLSRSTSSPSCSRSTAAASSSEADPPPFLLHSFCVVACRHGRRVRKAASPIRKGPSFLSPPGLARDLPIFFFPHTPPVIPVLNIRVVPPFFPPSCAHKSERATWSQHQLNK